MRRTCLVGLAVLVLVIAGCAVGPRMLTRQWDDWVNQQYVNTPWLTGNVVSASLIGVVYGVAGIGDAIANTYYFWAMDAEPFGKGVGTPFNHKNPTMPARK